MKDQKYIENGINISKSIISGLSVEVEYYGLLAKSGAEKVYVHFGYNKEWKESNTVLMSKRDDKFVTEIEIRDYETLNIAFTDGVDNWDNNSTNNFVFEIEKSKAKRNVSKDTKNSKKKEKKVKKVTSIVEKEVAATTEVSPTKRRATSKVSTRNKKVKSKK